MCFLRKTLCIYLVGEMCFDTILLELLVWHVAPKRPRLHLHIAHNICVHNGHQANVYNEDISLYSLPFCVFGPPCPCDNSHKMARKSKAKYIRQTRGFCFDINIYHLIFIFMLSEQNDMSRALGPALTSSSAALAGVEY